MGEAIDGNATQLSDEHSLKQEPERRTVCDSIPLTVSDSIPLTVSLSTRLAPGCLDCAFRRRKAVGSLVRLG